MPPGPLAIQLPATPKVPALTFSEFPLVLKLPLSTIPQVVAFNVAFPFMFMPSTLAVGGPNVYKQPLLAPPLSAVATARLPVTGSLIGSH